MFINTTVHCLIIPNTLATLQFVTARTALVRLCSDMGNGNMKQSMLMNMQWAVSASTSQHTHIDMMSDHIRHGYTKNYANDALKSDQKNIFDSDFVIVHK